MLSYVPIREPNRRFEVNETNEDRFYAPEGMNLNKPCKEEREETTWLNRTTLSAPSMNIIPWIQLIVTDLLFSSTSFIRSHRDTLRVFFKTQQRTLFSHDLFDLTTILYDVCVRAWRDIRLSKWYYCELSEVNNVNKAGRFVLRLTCHIRK